MPLRLPNHWWLQSGGGFHPPFTPTRAGALGVNVSFMGGLIIDSPTYGLMPWFDAALAWCDPVTRSLVYAAKKAAKDTHCVLEIPNGYPLYDEWGQFYSPEKFPALDWTNGETKLGPEFLNLVREIIAHGFYVDIAMDERQDHSLKIVPLVAQALKDSKLTPFGFVRPGWDSVFYGWPVEAIMEWGRSARAINPDILLGLEFTPGHIPFGEGGDDYLPGGRMDDFDVVLGEFNSFTPGNGSAGGQVWQVVGRMVEPYTRPADQPQSSDRYPPPFYLVDSPRGPRSFCFYETDDPYGWVRIDPNNSEQVQGTIAFINAMRQYARGLGCQYTG